MRRLSLYPMLIGINAGFILVAVSAIYLTGESTLRRHAEKQLLARARLTGEKAAAAIEHAGESARAEAAIPTSGLNEFLRGQRRRFLLLTLAVCSVAALGGSLIARRLIRPVGLLTEASARIGRGDLATPIPRVLGAEIGALSAAMEDMRRRLLHLTAELTRRQAEAQAVVSGIVEGVFAVDRERRVRFLNPQAASLIGVTQGDALGRFCGDVLHPESVAGLRPCEDRCPILHARFRGSARATEHLRLASGRRVSVVITSAAPSQSGASFEEGFSGGAPQYQVMRDETDVESARRARDGVLANISHEFRTPLTAQLASIEILRDRLPDLSAAETRTLVLSLERGTLRLTQLIDNLLESVRIESGRDSIRRQPVEMDEIIEEAVALTSPLIDQRGQSLLVDLPYPAPSLAGDAPRLVQVFVNLLANANKFAPTGSTIRIGGAVGEDDVVLWVEDQGPGLPPGDTNALFARFVRSGGEEPEPGGLGLGLWIVKSIVERHGGRVEAQAGAEGPGLRMCVYLPRAARA